MSSGILETMVIASLAGGSILRKYFEEENFSISRKSVSYDLVTSADKESQERIISILTDCFPQIPVIGEEGCEQIRHYPEAFYVDPLDGTLVMSYNSCKNRKVDGHCGKVHFMEILRKGGHPLWRDYQKVKYYTRS